MKNQLRMLRGLNFSYYATSAVLMPFLPIYFEGRGYSSSQIGLLMMIGPFVSIFAQPIWGYLSDRYQTLKLIIFGLWGMTLLSSVGIFTTTGYSFALLFMLLLYFFMLSSVPLLDTLTIKSAVQAGASYGSIRLWGSIGFTLLAVSSGFILQALGGLQNIPYLYWSIWMLPLVLLLFLKDERSPAPRVSFRSFTSMFRNGHFLWFLLLVFILTVPHRMNDVMFVLYLKDLGATNAMAGWAWALAAFSEIPTFALLSRYMHKFHELALLGIVAILYTLRWLAYGWITDPLMLMVLQVTHSITFAVFWIVAVQYAVRLVPPELQSTGQSMLSMVFLGLAGITGGFVGGWIKDEWSGAGMYMFGAGMTCIAAILLLGTHVYYRKKTIQLN
ncbi:MFS transporter [Paenibacillus naphthalenovorans]|uniref:MFS transporter n=1 Tax=Paenibacillus naphthalenovorans TaxID=162209 RepID=UPI000880BDD0|nr:MFS transporter [Paenibacillus naphthalenovorans]SDI61211.1 MFS transporter, PPP family, 3-phenylpropionic acid transporter [Paenibacillus naphthalenovorans]